MIVLPYRYSKGALKMILYDKDGHPYTWFSPMDEAKLQDRLDKELKEAVEKLIMELQGEHNG